MLVKYWYVVEEVDEAQLRLKLLVSGIGHDEIA